MSTTATTDTREVTLDTETVDVIAILESQAEHAGRAARAKTTWTLEGDDEWVANYGGYFGGSVDKRDSRYVASDTFGLVVGEFASLEDAQTALAGHLHVMLPSVIRPTA